MILLATTILSMSAGFAAADVAVSGSARMGVVSTDGASAFSSRVRMSFSGSGTTDGGLAFGGSFSAHDSQAANDGDAGSVFISGAFGKISMGDVDSGDKAAVGQIDGGVGFTGLGSGNSIGYAADGGFSLDDSFYDEAGVATVSTGGAKVLYTYSAGGIAFSASSAQLSSSDTGDKTAFGAGASYTSGALTVALGYGSSDLSIAGYGPTVDGSVTDVSASAGYVMGATTIKAIYQDKQVDVSYESEDMAASAMSAGVSVKHTIDALSLTGFAISTKFEADMYPGESVSANRYGIGASYDLGGGASFAAGWAHNEAVILDNDDHIVAGEVDKFDAGVNFSF